MACLLACACGKTDVRGEESEVRSPLVICAEEGTDAVPVKAAETGTKPGNFGIVVVEKDSFTEYLPFLSNIEATSAGTSPTSWTFRYDGSRNKFQTLYLISKKNSSNEKVDCDVYAYAPYIAGRTPAQLTSLPFSFSSQTDVMWADQNLATFNFSDKDYNNRGIVIDGTSKKLQFDFHHVLSLLQFQLRIKNSDHPYSGGYSGNTRYYLSSVKMTAKPGTLVGSGSLNALTGVFTGDDTYVTEQTWNWSSNYPSIPMDGSYAAVFNVLVCPGAFFYGGPHSYADGDYSFRFALYSQEKGYLPYADFTLLASQLGGNGFESGKKYIIQLTFDNYVHFDGITITDDWTEVNMEYGI